MKGHDCLLNAGGLRRERRLRLAVIERSDTLNRVKTFCLALLATGILATANLQARPDLPHWDNSLITQLQSKEMGKAAVETITAVYQEQGIEAALLKADELLTLLKAIPKERLASDMRSSYQKPAGALRLEMWYEAQTRTGNEGIAP